MRCSLLCVVACRMMLCGVLFVVVLGVWPLLCVCCLSLIIVRCLMFAVCCLRFAVCCSSGVVRCSLFVARWLSVVCRCAMYDVSSLFVCCLLLVGCCRLLPFVVDCRLSLFVDRCLLLVVVGCLLLFVVV